MNETHVIFVRILSLFVPMLLGAWARRRGGLTEETTRTLARFVTDVCFPALVFHQLLGTLRAETLAEDAGTLLLGTLLLGVGGMFAVLYARLLPAHERRSAAFLVATPNWIFLPLPIVADLHGEEGIRTVLLFNVPMQVLLWTAWIRMLKGRGAAGEGIARRLAGNAGLLATAAGAAAALWWPGLAALSTGSRAGLFASLAGAGLDGLALVGSLTVPLSLVLIGAQIAGLPGMSAAAPSAALALILAGRLAVLPLALGLLMAAAGSVGLALPRVTAEVMLIVAAMPVAVSCSAVIDRFGGDAGLGARSIFFSTLLSLVSVPLLIPLLLRLLP